MKHFLSFASRHGSRRKIDPQHSEDEQQTRTLRHGSLVGSHNTYSPESQFKLNHVILGLDIHQQSTDAHEGNQKQDSTPSSMVRTIASEGCAHVHSSASLQISARIRHQREVVVDVACEHLERDGQRSAFEVSTGRSGEHHRVLLDKYNSPPTCIQPIHEHSERT